MASPFTAEGLACLQAVTLGLHFNFPTVIIEGETRSRVQKCKREQPDKSEISAIIRNIQNLHKGFQRVVFQHVSRIANSRAYLSALECLKTRKETYMDVETTGILIDGVIDRCPRELD